MVHPYLMNTLNAVVLIFVGLIGYYANPSRPAVALISLAVGLLLLACTYHLRKHNKFVLHTVTALTLLFGAAAVMYLYYGTYSWEYSYHLLVIAAISCFIAVGFFIGSFVRERRLRNNTIYKDDL